MTKYWINWQAPLWDFFIRKRKQFDVPLNTIVTAGPQQDDMTMISFTNSKGQQNGWVESRFLEPYINQLPVDCVDLSDIQTADPNDAQQYVDWEGYKQVNMCGEICIAYILGVKLSFVLQEWKARQLTLYKRIFGAGRATGTTKEDLTRIMDALAGEAHFNIANLESVAKKYSPAQLAGLLEKYHIIAACNINSINGALRSGRIGHWVCVVAVYPDRQGMGWIDVMNPFNNCVERYSWAEWVANTRNYPSGLIVERYA